MSTYTQITCHIVFTTKNRMPVLPKDHRKELFKYIYGILKQRQCHTFRIRLHLITMLLIAASAFGSTISIQNQQLSASFDSGKLTISSFATGKHIASIPYPEAPPPSGR